MQRSAKDSVSDHLRLHPAPQIHDFSRHDLGSLWHIRCGFTGPVQPLLYPQDRLARILERYRDRYPWVRLYPATYLIRRPPEIVREVRG